jgi:hypothetical protein
MVQMESCEECKWMDGVSSRVTLGRDAEDMGLDFVGM